MRLLLQLMCIACLACSLSGCAGDETGGTKSYSATEGPFELMVELETIENDTIVITRKLKYAGDRDIEIHHGQPLISVAVRPAAAAPEEYEIVHMFDSIGLTTAIKAHETITHGEPMRFKAARGDTVVSVLADFGFDGTHYSIPLEFAY